MVVESKGQEVANLRLVSFLCVVTFLANLVNTLEVLRCFLYFFHLLLLSVLFLLVALFSRLSQASPRKVKFLDPRPLYIMVISLW